MEDKNPIQVADKLFHILELLCDKGAMSLIDISNSLSINKTSAHRAISSLAYLNYVKQDPNGDYTATFKVCTLANEVINRIDIVQLIRPHLAHLANELGETVHLVQLDDLQAVYIDKVESEQNSIRMVSKIGNTVPLYCSAVGKSLMANMSDEEIKKIWEQSTHIAFTNYTITTYEDLIKEINHIRSVGYAMDNEEHELGVRCIAVSLPDYHNKSYAFSLSAPTSRFRKSEGIRFGRKLLEVKDTIHI